MIIVDFLLDVGRFCYIGTATISFFFRWKRLGHYCIYPQHYDFHHLPPFIKNIVQCYSHDFLITCN